jgi:hypothetical protein|tara:strand:- start:1434 stop:2366 length:933 start_codon:yes stop_codon:yes gene_type:complete
MLRFKIYSFLFIIVLGFCSWGFHAHKTIHKHAIYTLPSGMSHFFQTHSLELEERSVAADKRRYIDNKEACKHYIDIDLYGSSPFDSVPKNWFLAKEKYSEDTLKNRGILPWSIHWEYKKLVWAMDSGSVEQVIRHAADLGHYVSDACVPLHTSYNYNGQFTDQKGIHALWESRIPEAFSADYEYFIGKSVYLQNSLSYSWELIEESFSLLDSTLNLEEKISTHYIEDTKFRMSAKNGQIQADYTTEFISDYNTILNGMVERRLQRAILAVGSFWYSAWIDAGQPDLSRLPSKTENLHRSNKKYIPNRIHE